MLGWGLAWLGATGAISAWSAMRHAPALEQLIRNDVLDAMAPLGTDSVEVTVVDHRAVLSGQAATIAEHDALIRAARGSLAIREVDDQLSVSEGAPTVATLELVSESISVDDDVTGTDVSSDDVSEGVILDSELADGALTDEDVANVGVADVANADVADVDFLDDNFPDEEFYDEDPVDMAIDEIEEALDLGDAFGVELPVADPELEIRPVEDDSDMESMALLETETSVESVATLPVTRRSPALAAPSLTLALADRVLTIEGSLASPDDSLVFVDAAMGTFDLDYVSNSVDARASVGEADWLESLTTLLPALATLDNPGVAVVERQLTLSGTAPDAPTRDAVVSAALQRLGDLSLVEHIGVKDALPINETSASDGRIDDAIDVARISVAGETPRKAKKQNNSAPPARSLHEAWDQLPDKRIPFEPSSDKLTADSLRVLDRMADLLQAYPNVHIEIEGHTDATGDRDANLRLSQLRANAVRDHLVSRGVDFDQLTAYGYGEGLPTADNRTRRGRAANRRIEFTF